MEIRLLGPVEIVVGGDVWEVGPPQQRHTLAALAVDAGRPVSMTTLVERLWDEPPPAARRAVQAHLARIRRLLERAGTADGRPVLLERRSGGYLLDIPGDRVDLLRFQSLLRGARATPDSTEAAAQARALWRGVPLEGLDGRWVTQCRQAWRQHYVDATLLWARTADPTEVLGPLTELAEEFPLVEPVAEMVMRALAATGRPAEALEYFAAVRARLAEELGTDPSPALQAVHQATLRGELARAQVTPAQLPADVPGFAGREESLVFLDDLLARRREERSAAMVVAAVSGTAGVGKTALVVHWAHRVADSFPDGQLYVDLRGYTPAGLPMAPADGVRGFLDAFGVAPDRIPAGLDAQAALYRSLMSGKRVLVVLDNARDADQVRPLLPGTSSALVVTTSRDQLTPLVMAGAEPLSLDVLSRDEAWEMLERRLSARRLAAEPEAAREIIAACARLPLALALTVARVRLSRFTLATVAAGLSVGDQGSRLGVVFAASVGALTEPAARLFRLLGLHTGPAVSAEAAASLAGAAGPGVRRLLDELVAANLLAEPGPGRYTCHDLLRAYAIELVRERDTEAAQQAADLRLLDHYTHSAYHCALLLLPSRDPIDLPLATAAAGVGPERPLDYDAAMTWFGAAYGVLLAVQRHAVATGSHRHAWQLAWALDTYLGRRGHGDERLAAWQIGLRAAEALRLPVTLAYAYRRLGYIRTGSGAHDEASADLRRALDLYRQADDLVGQAYVHCDLARLDMRRGRHREARDNGRQGLASFRAAGHRSGQAEALNAIGWYSIHLGDHTGAVACCEEALALLEDIGLVSGQAHTWDTLGYAHHHLRQFDRAVAGYQRALDLCRELGDLLHEADTLVRLAGTHLAAGDPEAARPAFDAALDIYDDLDPRAAARTRAAVEGK